MHNNFLFLFSEVIKEYIFKTLVYYGKILMQKKHYQETVAYAEICHEGILGAKACLLTIKIK